MTEVNSMTATNLATGEQATFSHQDPRMAFSYIHAQETNRLTHWACLSDDAKHDFIADSVRIGKRSWGFGDWAIPFFDETTQKGMYLENRGLKCPRCLSVDIEPGAVDIDGPEAKQDVCCNACDATWTDIFTLSNVDIG